MIYKSQHLFWSILLSYIIAPYYKFFNFFRKNFNIKSLNIKTVLVTEYHRIGDLIIIAPILKSIKMKFPDAKIILICNKSSEQLAKHLKLADNIFGIDVPWTNWDYSLFKWIKTRSLARSFRTFDVDIAIDFKGDIRNSWFLWHTKPKISFGYSTTGGKFFFTHPKRMNQNLHQFLRAQELIREIGCVNFNKSNFLNKYKKDGSIVLHPGTSDNQRSWLDKYWIELANMLYPKYKISIVKCDQSKILIKKLKNLDLSVDVFEGDLIALMEWLSLQKCLIAPDSMAGHLASYIGIPTISLFGSQDPSLVKPYNKLAKVVSPDKSCVHIRKHWRLCSLCMASISPKKVFKNLVDHISYIERNL